MKWLVIALAVASTAMFAWFVHAHTEHVAPAIYISFKRIDNLTGGSTGLPAVDGFTPPGPNWSQFSTVDNEPCDATEWYKVKMIEAGKFIVIAHYRVVRNGTVENIDRTLPVRDHEPAATDWTKVDDATHACAYLEPGSTMSY
jgi:hypothetical protein